MALDPLNSEIPKKSNCLFWAISTFRKYGGYLAARWSLHYGYIPHIFYSDDMVTWWSYSPIKPKHGMMALLDCIWFSGYLEKGDDDYIPPIAIVKINGNRT
jgi:hypothetical protein